MSDETSTKVGELDMAKKEDRRLLARSAHGRWPLSDEMREGAVKALQNALANCRADDSRDVASLLRVLVAMEGQNQADDHLIHKEERADEGKPEAVTEIRVVRAEPKKLERDGGD